MYKTLSATLLAVALSILAFSSPGHAEAELDGPAILHPINVRQYEAATGLRRRDDEAFSNLDPNTQSQLIYGRPGDDGQLLFANMTLYAPDGLPIVLMERFEGLTSKVDCKGDDGAMSLVFKSKAAYDYALKAWRYINEKDDEQFLLIANHAGCGPDDERQPYKVSKVVDDATNLAIDMTTTVTSWSEVAGTYDIDFGQAIPYHRPSVRSRSFLGDVVNIGKDVLNAAEGNFEKALPMTFDIDVGSPGVTTQIYKSEGGVFEIDCVNCYVTGSWNVQGHIKVEHFSLDDLTLSASPSNFRAKLELEATISAEKDPESLNPDPIELFRFPIPGAGIAIKGIFSVGATVAYEVGTSATFAGTATADFGLEASLPNGASVSADINNPDQSSATGWAGSSLKPIFEVTKLEASIELSAYSQPQVELGIKLDNVGDVEVVVGIKLPEISSTLSADYDPKGLCSQSAGASKTGVKLTNSADISVSLSIEANLGDDDNKPKWSQTLFDVTEDLPSDCIPLKIPGLAGDSTGGSGTSKASPSPPPSGGTTTGQTCKPPGQTGICQSTSTTCAGGDYISGYCPGDSSIKCCPDKSTSPTTCTPPGKNGTCQSTSAPCPGASTNQCCPDSSPTKTTTCKPPGKTGVCQKTSMACDGGAYIAGYCPGDDTVKCCPDATPSPSAAGGGGCKREVVVVGGVERRMLVC